MTDVLMIDALGSGKGTRQLTRDAIGCGPRWICGVVEGIGLTTRIELAEDYLRGSRTGEVQFLLASGMTMDLPSLRKIGRKAEKAAPGSTRILGGPVCGEPARALRASGFDMAVVGEGEASTRALLEGADPADLPGVVERRGDEFSGSMRGPRVDQEEYGKLKPSTERVVDYPTHRASRVYVETVRGCSNFNRTKMPLSDGRVCQECAEGCNREECPAGIPPGCGFCSVPSVFGPPKSREVRLVAEEIADLVSLGVRRFVLSAPDFLDYFRGVDARDPRQPGPNYEAIGELLAASRSAAEGAYLTIENVKPNLFSEEAARLISRFLPGSEVHIGCETGDEEHSRALGRPSLPGEALAAARIAKRNGLRPYVYFIHGLPGQTRETARKTSELITRLEPHIEKITVYRYKPLPGSAFEGEVPGNPGWVDEDSSIIAEAARKVNLGKKSLYVGGVMEGFAAERNYRRRGEMILFPARGGPIVSFPAPAAILGKRVKVKVTGMASDRLLRGKLVEVMG